MAKKRVLLIDDDEGIIEAVRAILEYAGYEVVDLSTDNHLIKTVADLKPQIILLDLLLSGKDGRQIAQELKKDAQTKQIPIIMLSAHPTAEAASKEGGADGFLAKPFDMNELLQKIETLIK